MKLECRSPHDSKGVTNIAMQIIFIVSLCLGVSAVDSFAQIPEPGPAKSVNIPAVKETKLKNGLTVAVVEKKGVPIVTVQLLVKSGAESEGMAKAGLANLTASMLTKGTKTRTAEQIAEEMEFLGGSINSGAGWNSSFVTISVTSDKLDQAMAIMADVLLNPAFKQEELDLLKTQTLDGLTYNLTQPGFLGNYVASKYSFDEHPAGGTSESLTSITRADVVDFRQNNYDPEASVLIFAGDITSVRANLLANKLFGRWKSLNERKEIIAQIFEAPSSKPETPVSVEPSNRLLVIDLPNSGQASVTYALTVVDGRVEDWNSPKGNSVGKEYYSASVLNSLLGGGYSSRLNQEIRIKRGLSYGAGSSFAWRFESSNFSTRTQTKNESAVEVVELVLAEIKRLTNTIASAGELTPRKSVLTGGFGRNLETTGGLANALADLYSFELPASELNSYVKNVNVVTETQIRDFAKQRLLGGDIILVGDYSVFKDDLAKRFPKMRTEVIKASELDLTKDSLRK